MLRIKNLIENDVLANELAGLWFEKDTYRVFFYRSSANVLYLVVKDDGKYFLRYSPKEEKDISNLETEISLLLFLDKNKLNVNKPIPSKTGKYIHTYQDYYVSCFKEVIGKTLDDVEVNEEICFEYGRLLKIFHKYSKAFGESKLRNHFSVLNWVDSQIDNQAIKNVIAKNIDEYKELSQANYGIVHYDFELDNIIYNESNTCLSVIDFEDLMVHYYDVDVIKALLSMDEYGEDYSIDVVNLKKAFLEGYGQTNFVMNRVHLLFIDLYKYARITYSLAGIPKEKPEWMNGLISKLEKIQNELEQKLLKY